jgi:hypothetical protein
MASVQTDVVRGTSAVHVHDPAYRAYQILHVAFAVMPTITGTDKFVSLLATWDQYLSPAFAGLSPFPLHTTMLLGGVVEMLAGLLVALRPRIGAYVVAAWLALIVVNLFLVGSYYDVMLRDLVLCLAALALGRLAAAYDHAR